MNKRFNIGAIINNGISIVFTIASIVIIIGLCNIYYNIFSFIPILGIGIAILTALVTYLLIIPIFIVAVGMLCLGVVYLIDIFTYVFKKEK